MDPTVNLLWEAARPDVRPARVADALDAGADVPTAARLAASHGLGPMLHRALDRSGRLPTVDPTSAAALRAEAELWRAHSRMLLPRAIELAVEPLVTAGLEPVIWKGPAVACRYEDVALRPMSDIDMILPAGQHEAATAALATAGWRSVKAKPGEHYDTAFVHPSLPGLPVELHFALNSWRHRPNRLRSDDLWTRRRPIDLLGTKAWGLARDDEVVALAAHAGKPYHVFSRLVWATDLALVTDGIDWGAVRDRAKSAECRTVVAVALRLAMALGANPPWWVIEIPESGDRRRAIDELLDPQWLATVNVDELYASNQRLQDRLRFALTDRPTRALAMIAGEVADAPRGRRARRTLSSIRRASRAWLGSDK